MSDDTTDCQPLLLNDIEHSIVEIQEGQEGEKELYCLRVDVKQYWLQRSSLAHSHCCDGELYHLPVEKY